MTRKTKVEVLLNVIERIVGDDFCADLEARTAFHPDELTETEKECHRKLGLLYRLVHSLNRMHCCHSVHKDWRKEFGRMRQHVEEEMADESINKMRHPEKALSLSQFVRGEGHGKG